MVVVGYGTLVETLLESEVFGHQKVAFTGVAGTKHGRFEQANGGAFFLDEVGNASQSVQKKLLRLIEDVDFVNDKSVSVKSYLDTPLKNQLAELEYNYLKQALSKYQGKISKVIELSGMNPRTLNQKMKFYKLDKNDFY